MNEPQKGYFYEAELVPLLAAVIEAHRAGRERYWEDKLGQEEWSHTLQLLRDADSIAVQLMAAAADLVGPSLDESRRALNTVENEYRQHEHTFWEEFQRAHDLKPTVGFARDLTKLWDLNEIDEGLHEGSALRSVWERICIELARDVVEQRLPEAAKRLLLLVKQVMSARPTRPTTLFLRHVSRCYIWGFDTECVILCRSSLDTAFRHAVSDELCLQRDSRPPNGFTLKHRVEAAHPDLIDRDTYDSAKRVKLRGDKAVHYEPDGWDDVLGTISDTVKVIGQLSAQS